MAKLPNKRPLQRACCVAVVAAWLAGGVPAVAVEVAPRSQTEDQRPLSMAQIALFETPHLQNVDHAETLDYQFVREGPGGFTDRLVMHVLQVHPNRTKQLSFDFLTGGRRVAYPEIDNFRGNPLLLLVLERDAQEMKATLGLSATYFRNHIREAFVDHAVVETTQFALAGRPVPARSVTVRPFADDTRLEHFPTVQGKTYTFVLSDSVPGGLAELRIEMPPDMAMKIPAFAQRITFQGVEP